MNLKINSILPKSEQFKFLKSGDIFTITKTTEIYIKLTNPYDNSFSMNSYNLSRKILEEIKPDVCCTLLNADIIIY